LLNKSSPFSTLAQTTPNIDEMPVTLKRSALAILLLLAGLNRVCAQTHDVDSLKKAWQKNKQDSTLVQLLVAKATQVYLIANTDSGIACLRQSLVLSRKIHFRDGEVRSLASIATYANRRGDLPGSLKMTFDVLPKAIAINDLFVISQCYNTLGLDYSVLKDSKKALAYFIMATNVAVKAHLNSISVTGYNNIARQYLDMKQADSAQYFTDKAYALAIKTKSTNIGYLIRNFGIIQTIRGNDPKALDYFGKSIQSVPKLANHYLLSEDYRRMAEVYYKLSRADSCIWFAKKGFDEGKLDKNPELVMKSAGLLSDEYHSLNDYKNAYDYQQITLANTDSLFSQQKTLQIQNLTFNQEQQKQEIEAARKAFQNKVQLYTLLGVLAVFILMAGILLYANSQRKKANLVLQQRNEQIETQHKALEKTLTELKTTQTQLIQSEKMASLGELTAGIAHEIQNPLNFVNNFSEVNTELIEEMDDEIDKANLEEVKAIAADIKANLQKISQHGKRADFIVKGMLQHSRTSTGEKHLTNINVLADEFLKLSYHGLRAKDKNFNAELVTHFDQSLPAVNIVQQDIGRVLLNLFNNAFYAVALKAKTAGPGYNPTVEVTTFVSPSGGWGASVRDNGNGIPDAIKEKIMQPFFTTKPTGEGTGLGLSLSYDVVVKGHGGTIDIESKEGEGSTFTITMPYG